MAMDSKKAFFLDRDGTINTDYPYIAHPDKIELIPEALPGLRKIKEAGYLVIVVSNQSGIGRGLIEADRMEPINQKLDSLLIAAGLAPIDAYAFCPHHPDDGCACRKPGTKLVNEMAEKFHINIAESFFVGDKLSDVQAGHASGCKASVLVLTGKGVLEAQKATNTENDLARPSFIAQSLSDAVDFCLVHR